MAKNTGFRGWFYFRQGWSNYFAFLFAAVNTLTVTYYLAIERYPLLEGIFPNFVQYVVIITAIGIPSLIGIGYAHWKKTSARKAEIDIFYEVNPYIIRVLVNTEIMIKLNLELNDKILKLVKNGSLTETEKKELEELQIKIKKFVHERKFRGKEDWNFFQNLDNKEKF